MTDERLADVRDKLINVVAFSGGDHWIHDAAHQIWDLLVQVHPTYFDPWKNYECCGETV